MDEATEKEKKVTTYFLVNANDAKEAYERTEEHLKEMLVPFTIPKIEESPIIEVYQYEKAAPKGHVKREAGDVSPAELLYMSLPSSDKNTIVDKFFDNGADEIFIGWLTTFVGCSQNTAKEIGKLLSAERGEDDEHEEECAFEDDSVEVVVGNGSGIMANVPKEPFARLDADGATIEYVNPSVQYVTNPKTIAIDPTDGQAVAFNAMTLETYLEDIRPNYTADVIDSIRSAYKRHSEDLFLMQLSLMAFTRPQREMIADLCNNE